MRVLNFEVKQEERDEFSGLLEQFGNIKKGVLMSGVITGIDGHFILVDVGLKSEGRIPQEEFFFDGKSEVPAIGSTITVMLEILENRTGDVVLSYSKAVREEGWERLEDYFRQRKPILGTVVKKVQGGCIVNLAGVSAFLPKSHMPANVKDSKELLGKQYPCLIIKMDRTKSNIVVSSKSSGDQEQSVGLTEGQVVKGVVKNLTDSAAYVDLGGIVGRLHISEIDWAKTKDPSEKLKVGEEIDVKIISMVGSKINLSIKQLGEDPWLNMVKQFGLEVGKEFEVSVSSIDERGAFVVFENGLDARLRSTDIAWMKRYQASNSLSNGQKIKVRVLEVDEKKHRIYVSLKHTQPNPVEQFAKEFKQGDEIECKVVQISDLGYVVQIRDGLDGIVPNMQGHISNGLKIGESLKAYIWDIDVENGHIILGPKKPE